MRKTLLTKVLAVVAACMTSLSLHAVDETFVVDGLHYRVTSDTDKTCCLFSTDALAETSLVIPSIVQNGGNEYKVTVIGENAFNAATALAEVTYPETLETIEHGAFFKTTKLRTIHVLNPNVTDIMASPFANAVLTNAKVDVPQDAGSNTVWHGTASHNCMRWATALR